MVTILSTVFVLGILVFIHELGHFLAAKLSGIRVDTFSMGYPPRLIGKKIGDTDYCISAVPFGGYVKISGMVDESMDTEELKGDPQPWEFRSKPWINRFSVILAGPVMNLVLAYLIFVGGVFVYGIGEFSPEPVVGIVSEGEPAEAAGLAEGDRILSINDIQVSSWDEMSEIVHAAPEQAMTFTWMRDNQKMSQVIIPARKELPNAEGKTEEVGLIGIGPVLETRRAGFFEAFQRGGDNFIFLTNMIVDVVGKLVTGRESVKSLAGPVAIAKMAGESARSGFGNLVGFLAMLSLNLGILNLLPIPVLDGGHLLMLSVEGIARREVPLKVKMVIQQVFMVLLLGLMGFVIYNDILRVLK